MLRSLPNFKGKRRLVKLLLGSRLERMKDVIVEGKFSCEYVLPNLKENVGFDIYVNGIYEENSFRTLSRLLPPNGTLLDIGGNIGAISIPICKTRPDVKAVVIEAVPWIYEYLKGNVIRNRLDNLVLMNNAVFDRSDVEVDFFCPSDVYGKGSMAAVFTSDSVKVTTVNVDSLPTRTGLKRFDVIKVDVEGFEYFVFKGGESILSKSDAPVIFFEFVDWAENSVKGVKAGAAQELLQSYGYSLYVFDKGKWSVFDDVKKVGSFDILACKGAISERWR